jgi:hypothetical protein
MIYVRGAKEIPSTLFGGSICCLKSGPQSMTKDDFPMKSKETRNLLSLKLLLKQTG